MQQFQVGDKVRLNSGGPEMTVSCWLRDGQVICKWRSDGCDCHAGKFNPSMLTLIEKAQPKLSVAMTPEHINTRHFQSSGSMPAGVFSVEIGGDLDAQFVPARNGWITFSAVEKPAMEKFEMEFKGEVVDTSNFVKAECQCPDLLNGHHNNCPLYKG